MLDHDVMLTLTPDEAYALWLHTHELLIRGVGQGSGHQPDFEGFDRAQSKLLHAMVAAGVPVRIETPQGGVFYAEHDG